MKDWTHRRSAWNFDEGSEIVLTVNGTPVVHREPAATAREMVELEMAPNGEWRWACPCCGRKGVWHSVKTEAQRIARVHRANCEKCREAA